MQTVIAIRSFVFQYPKTVALVALTGNLRTEMSLKQSLIDQIKSCYIVFWTVAQGVTFILLLSALEHRWNHNTYLY